MLKEVNQGADLAFTRLLEIHVPTGTSNSLRSVCYTSRRNVGRLVFCVRQLRPGTLLLPVSDHCLGRYLLVLYSQPQSLSASSKKDEGYERTNQTLEWRS